MKYQKYHQNYLILKKKEKVFFEQIKSKKSIIDVNDELIMFLVFGSELFNKKLKIFWKEIRKKIKIIVTNGIENDKNSLIEFKYKFYFEKMFFLFNDENKKHYFKKKHILLIYLEK